ncbi:hypothetical protein [Cystobacter fuscus]|uniref:hypothetical protein n=1 Tax=Cystobacter fuscus TaxID=43 RepID=UPI002B2E1DE0|nr:hypothetical protein F0U63_16585 [Cystobacter fuscus]
MIALLLMLLLLAAVSGVLLSIQACPELSLAELLLAPTDLPAKLEGGASWKVSVPEYQTTTRRGLEPRANLGRAWTEGGEVTATPQLTQHLADYSSPWRAWVQSQLLRRTSSRLLLPLEQVFPRQEVRDQLPSSAYVECEEGDEATCQAPIYHARHGQYLLRIRMMGSEGGVHPEVFGDAVLLFEEGLTARLSTCW